MYYKYSHMSTGESSTPIPETFGEFIRQFRIANGLTQRDVARQIDMLPSNLCKLELGALTAPKDAEQLTAIANALGIKEGTKDSQRFFDLAGKSSESIPVDLAEIISHNATVPLLLRTIGNRRLTKEQIETVVRIIKGV
jgi:transcriptional regulator with XRE-family HTH domain